MNTPTAQYDAASKMWVAQTPSGDVRCMAKRGPGYAEERLRELLQRVAEVEAERQCQRPVAEVEDGSY